MSLLTTTTATTTTTPPRTTTTTTTPPGETLPMDIGGVGVTSSNSTRSNSSSSSIGMSTTTPTTTTTTFRGHSLAFPELLKELDSIGRGSGAHLRDQGKSRVRGGAGSGGGVAAADDDGGGRGGGSGGNNDEDNDDDDDDPYWNSSRLTGFSFEEDWPTMLAQKPVKAEQQPKKNIEFRPRLESKPTTTPQHLDGVSSLVTAGRSAKEAVEDIFVGGYAPYSLAQFRSLDAKLQLLDAALDIGDTSTTQVVILFLRGTLKPAIFQKELISRPAALQAYHNYLRMCGDHSEFIEQLSLSGHAEEAARQRYAVVARIDDLKAKTRVLATSVNTHFSDSADQGVIRDQLELLQLQAKIQEIDEVTRQVSETLLGASLFDTIRYCAKHHANDPDTHFASPGYLKQAFRMSTEQFTHACISGYAESENYQAIESFLESKNWLGKKKLSSSIGFEMIVLILHRYKAPVDLLEKYIAYVDDVEERMEIAKRVGAMNALVNCYVQTKNRVDLDKLVAKLPRDSTAALLAQSSLNNPAIKWSN